MEKFLRPERFDVEPTSISADQQWLHWKQTFSNFLKHMKDASEESKCQLLTNYVAPNVYKYISESKTFKEAIDTLESLYIKPKNETYARYTLATRRQQAGESIDQYFQVLKQLSKECNFKSVTAEQNKNEYIRDAFVSGLSCSRVRQRLLESTTLTLNAAFNQARALEMAELQSTSYPGLPATTTTVAAAASKNTESNLEILDETTAGLSKTEKCYFCGENRHPRTSCPAKNATCKKCNKKGHYQRVCKSKQYNPASDATASTDTIASVSAVSPNCLKKSIVKIKVNGVELDALIDTGSSLSFINYSLVKKCGIKVLPFLGRIAMANSSLSTDITGRCNVEIEIEGHTYNNSTMLIMKNLCSEAIIGHDVLRSHSSVNITFHGRRPPLKICSVAVAKVPPISLFANLTPNCTPIATKSRKHSNENNNFIASEIKELLQDEIIEPSNSPWRAQAFVVKEGNHKARMVIDYSQTINKFTKLDAYPLPKIEEVITKVSKNEVFSSIDLKSAYHQIPILESERKYTAFEACGKLYQFRRVPFGVTNGVACFQRVIDQIVENENLEGTFPYLDDVTIGGKNQEEHDRNLERFLAAAEKYNLTLNKEKCQFSVRTVTLLGYVISNKTIKPDPNRLQPLRDLPIPKEVASLRRALGMLSHYSKWIPRFSEKIRPLLQKNPFPLSNEAISALQVLKNDVAKAARAAIQEDIPFRVETDASDFAIAATLSQADRPVAFFSRTLNKSEQQHSSIEKEAYAIVEALRYWRHYLIGRHFEVVTDQRSVSFMFNQQHSSKIKNEKIIRWRLELACFNFNII